MENNDFKKKITKIFIIFAVAIILILGFDKISSINHIVFSAVSPFIIGTILAVILNMPVRFFETKCFKKDWKMFNKAKRPISILLSFIIFILVIAIVCILIVPNVGKALSNMSQAIPPAISNFTDLLQNKFELNEQTVKILSELKESAYSWDSLVEYAIKQVPDLSPYLTSAFNTIKGFISSITDIVIAFVFGVYALMQKEKILCGFKRVLNTFLPQTVCWNVTHFMKTLHQSFESFIHGQCLECFLVALIFTVFSSIFGFQCSLVIGIAMFFLAFVPYVGNFVACVLGTTLTLIMESPVRALWFCVLFIVIQTLDGYFLYPKVIGMKVNMPPLLIFVSAIVGGGLFGFAGVILSIPIVTTVYVLINEKIEEKEKLKNNEVAT